MEERLCPDCAPLGMCMFKKAIHEVVDSVCTGGLTNVDAQKMIMDLRVKARDQQRCPNVNYDPWYPGIDKL